MIPIGFSIDKATGVVLLIYVIAALVPAALNQIFGANTTGWDAGTVALWGLIPLFVVIGLIRYFASRDGGVA